MKKIVPAFIISILLVSITFLGFTAAESQTSIQKMTRVNPKLVLQTQKPKKMLVLVNNNIYDNEMKTKINRYANDVQRDTDIEIVKILKNNWDNHVEVRKLIKNEYHDENSKLIGCLLVGNIPTAWYHNTGSRNKETYPIDLYYADLNFKWGPENGTRDDPYTSWDRWKQRPEIWIGRIKSDALSGDESFLIKNYFDKNHKYRTGKLSLPNRALVYIDEGREGDGWTSPRNVEDEDQAVGMLYKDRTLITEDDKTKPEDYKKRLMKGYEWIALHAHSSELQHTFFHTNGWSNVNLREIKDMHPKCHFYVLQCCHVCNYMRDHIAGYYLFDERYGLAVIGNTQSGGLVFEEDLYQPIQQGNILGEAVKKWFREHGPPYHCSAYGMTILGDPTLKPDTTPPSITDIEPQTGLYLQDRQIIPLEDKTIYLGDRPTICANIQESETGISKVEFYLDGELEKTIEEDISEYKWKPRHIYPFNWYEIAIKAYDKSGNIQEITLAKLLIILF